MAANPVCRNKGMALAVIGAITQAMSAGTQRSALESVAEYIRRTCGDIPAGYEERAALKLKIKTEIRDCMDIEERKAEAAFFLEGIA